MLLSPTINEKYGHINLKEVATSKVGLWQSQLCIDASTKIEHVERDCTYTLISIPKQDIYLGEKASKHMYFQFSLNKSNIMIIPYHSNFSFLFSGLCVVHRQNHPTTNFVNIASYGNARLFNHIRASFDRLNKTK